MKTENITIAVASDTAKVYRETSPEMRRKIDALLSLLIDETIREDETSLEEIMRHMSREAKANGLTLPILESILDDRG